MHQSPEIVGCFLKSFPTSDICCSITVTTVGYNTHITNIVYLLHTDESCMAVTGGTGESMCYSFSFFVYNDWIFLSRLET